MNCDRIAPLYRWMEYAAFGRALERRRLEYIDEASSARRILVLGDGDGRFTAELLRQNREALVESIDLSLGMLRLARRRIEEVDGGRPRIRLHHGDALSFVLTGEYDVVVSHFFLDCLTAAQVEDLISRVSGHFAAEGRWLVSEFQVPARGLWRRLGRWVIGVMYLFFRLTTGLHVNRLPDHRAAFAARGFERSRQRAALGGLLVSECWVKANWAERLDRAA